jgi:hypothetical protein
MTLLTERKVAKLIDLPEELRRDLPDVRNRQDPEAAAPQQSINPDLVLAALDEHSEPPTPVRLRAARRGRPSRIRKYRGWRRQRACYFLYFQF